MPAEAGISTLGVKFGYAEGKLDDEISKRIEKVAADLTAQFS